MFIVAEAACDRELRQGLPTAAAGRNASVKFGHPVNVGIGVGRCSGPGRVPRHQRTAISKVRLGVPEGRTKAVSYIMGHTPSSNDMAAIYRQKTFDTQLRKLTDHVHAWLNGATVLR